MRSKSDGPGRVVDASDAINRVHVLLCFGTALIGVAALIGWTFDIHLLKSVLPGLTTMKANTALGLLIAAVGLISVPTAPHSHDAFSRVSFGCGAFVTILGLATLAEYLFGFRLGIDELLFADPDTTSAPYNGRMAPATAISFAALGALIALLVRRSGAAVIVAHGLALVPAGLGALSLIGYAYGTEGLYNFGPYVSVALNSSLGLFALAASALLTRMDDGWRRSFLGHPAASTVLARLLPWSLFLPFGTGLLVLEGTHIGFYAPLYGPALFAVATAGSFVGLSWAASAAARRVEADLMASEARFRQLAETLPAMVFIADAAGRTTYVNGTFLRFAGIPAGDLLDDRWHLTLDGEHSEEIEAWRQAVLKGNPYEAQCRIRRADGAYRWPLARGLPLRDARGGVTGWFGTFTDIQELVDTRETLARSNEELETKVSERTAELVQLQKMDAIGQLTGGIAHDFNNLLTPVIGNLDLVLTRLPEADDRARRLVNLALAAATRAATLVQRLLAFARRQDLHPCAVNIADLLIGMEDLLRRSVGTSAAIRIEVEPNLSSAMVDPHQLELALLNLVINSRDAMPRGGTISICACDGANRYAKPESLQIGDYVCVSVGDTGVGMDQTTLSRAIEPFFTTKGADKGTGLGLSMAHGLAGQSGGALVLKSNLGSGTTAEIWLPAAEDRAEAPLVKLSPKPASRASMPSGTTVLLVDDQAIVRLGAVEMLIGLGYQVIEAGSATEALVVLSDQHKKLDILVTDYLMPGATGAEIAAEARKLRPGLPVLLVTGYAHLADEATKTLPRLSKPFRQHELAAQVSRLLGRSEDAADFAPIPHKENWATSEAMD